MQTCQRYSRALLVKFTFKKSFCAVVSTRFTWISYINRDCLEKLTFELCNSAINRLELLPNTGSEGEGLPGREECQVSNSPPRNPRPKLLENVHSLSFTSDLDRLKEFPIPITFPPSRDERFTLPLFSVLLSAVLSAAEKHDFLFCC